MKRDEGPQTADGRRRTAKGNTKEDMGGRRSFLMPCRQTTRVAITGCHCPVLVGASSSWRSRDTQAGRKPSSSGFGPRALPGDKDLRVGSPPGDGSYQSVYPAR